MAHAEPSSVTSSDGTRIAFEQAGEGPALVLVPAALSGRGDTGRLAAHLAGRFTVVSYDRRGRGQSGDAPRYSAEREVEDLRAVIDATGGSAFLFGSSSGAALALDAANRLGDKVRGLFLYEPPFIVDEQRPPIPEDLPRGIQELVSAGRRNEAVKLFFREGMGIPGFAVTLMRWLMPGWSKMAAMAHTIPYDLAILAGTQDGKPLPAARWSSVTAPALVMVGGRSEAFFHDGARALTRVVPAATYRALPGRDHSAVVTAAKALAAEVQGFFSNVGPRGQGV